MLFADFRRHGELLFRLQFRAAGADDVETAGIAELVDVFVVENDVFVIQKTARAALEADEDVLRIRCLQRIVKTADDVVAARRLSAGKDHADDLLLRYGGILSLHEDHFAFPVGIREQRRDLFLIRYALRFLPFLKGDLRDAVPEHSRKLRAVFQSFFLQ